MTIEIRQLELEESIKVLHFLSSYAFRPTPPLPEFEEYAERIRNRKGAKYYAVFEDGQPQAVSCATTPLIQNIRGQLMKMGGVANVASHPAARRRGYVRALMHHMYQEFNQENYPVSCLYPFKESFYQRLGHVTLPQAKKISFDPRNLGQVMKMELPGSVDMVSFQEGYNDFRNYLLKLQKTTHGMSLFSLALPETAKDHKAWLVFARHQGEVIGVMNYIIKDGMMNQTLTAYDFLFSNPLGKFLLLDWVAKHVDQVSKAELVLMPELAGEILATDIRPQFDGWFLAPMGRVISVPALAGLPSGTGEITVRVTDEDCAWNNGVWTLSSRDGKFEVSPADQPACDLTIHGLTALVYGAYDPDEFSLRGWGNPNTDQQQILRQMFPPAIPFLLAMF